MGHANRKRGERGRGGGSGVVSAGGLGFCRPVLYHHAILALVKPNRLETCLRQGCSSGPSSSVGGGGVTAKPRPVSASTETVLCLGPVYWHRTQPVYTVLARATSVLPFCYLNRSGITDELTPVSIPGETPGTSGRVVPHVFATCESSRVQLLHTVP